MKKRLKNIGKKIMKKIDLNKTRSDIFDLSMQYIIINGWNNNLFKLITQNNNYKYEEIISLFPNGYVDLLKYFFERLNQELTFSFNNSNFLTLKTHEKIREIILLRLKNYNTKKKIIKRTYFTLLLPINSKIASLLLYKTIDQMWYIAGDSSTDFNYYSKRAILAAIYSSTVLYWINNDYNFKKTKIFLDNKLLQVFRITRIKRRFKNISNLLFQMFNVIKDLVPTRQ